MSEKTDFKSFDQKNAALIDSLYLIDQNVQNELMDAIQSSKGEEIKVHLAKQTLTFDRHIPILKAIFEDIGYPTVEKVGKKSSSKFFTLVQHSDSDVKFQEKMLTELIQELANGNVNIKNYAFLTDRVKIAQNEPQIYGTQLAYNTTIGQAYPKSLIDSSNVNSRRKSLGLESLEVYLNKATLVHFENSKSHYDRIGISEPTLYEITDY